MKRVVLFAGCIAAVLFGCGSPEPAAAPQISTPSPSEGEVTASTASADDLWLGRVSADVFFDDPAEKFGGPVELGVESAVASATTVAPSVAVAPDEPTPSTTQAAAGDVTWSNLIRPEVLDEESKLLRTRLTGNLQRVATYNRSVAAIENDATVLAMLAGVAERLDAEMRWKARSPAVRSLAAEVSENATGSGRSAFEEARRPFERLLVILDGGPTDGVDAEPTDFGDYAHQSALMTRTKQSFDWMKGTVVSADRLAEEKDAVIREASLLAAVGQVIKDESYGYGDEPSYQTYADAFIAACLQSRDAAVADDFNAFSEAVGRVQNQCAACHSEYAFGDGGL